MIKLNKFPNIPLVLRSDGIAATNNLVNSYQQDNNYFVGRLSANVFNSDIYGDNQVKEQLIIDQSGKCCFCESKMLHITFADVEHFRPKMEVQQAKRSRKIRPGYFWLAYNWNNLMLSCEKCNRTYKRNYFPLRTGVVRSMPSSQEPITDTLLINPYLESPEEHLTFSGEYVNAKTDKGTHSIEYFGLGRKDLLETRGERLRILGIIKYFSNSASIKLDSDTINEIAITIYSNLHKKTESEQKKIIDEIKNILDIFISYNIPDKVEYAGMLRANFTQQ